MSEQDEHLPRRRKWVRKTVVIPVLTLLLAGGAAFAVFNLEATGNDATAPGHATTATVGTQAVTVASSATALEANGSTLTPLTPTVGSTPSTSDEQIVLAGVTSTAAAQFSAVNATVLTGTGANSTYVLNAANGGAPAVGCLASWYQVAQTGLNVGQPAASFAFSADVSLPVVEPALPSNAYAFVGAAIWLQDSTGSTDQNACAGVQPEIELAVS